MNKKVSIIIPCFNGERFIDRCLHSIEIQNYPHIEVVVVNDGSIDQSESKILEWKEVLENKKISLIYIKQKNQGIGSAINTGLKYISGEYLLLLDIDDEYLQGALLERVQFLESHREMDVVRSNGWYVRKNGKSLFIYDECEKNIQDVFTALLEGKTNNWAGSYMVRVSSLFKFYPEREIYQSKYGQNLQLLLPLLYNKKCGFIDKPHMNYNQQENSLTKTNVEKSKKKKSLDNANGFRDIREHMVQIIIHDEREREYYLDIIQNFYWRSVMQIAGVYNDDILMKEAFLSIKKQLDSGRIVLFSGTPCQVAGLKAFLKRDYENLVCIDFVCHGVPSPMVWEKYVKYRSLTDNSDSFPQHINLRNKESGWSHYAYSVEFAYADKKRYLCKNGDDPFMQLFVKDYILRESCSSCHFKGYHRVSDITLGDFWGIWNINPKMDDNKGTSLILTHTAKGEKMMNAVSENIKCEQVYLEQAARENPSLLRSSVHKQNRDIVLKTIESENFQEILPLLQVKQPQRRSKKEIIKRVLKKLCGLG